jgi:hypothetical protein
LKAAIRMERVLRPVHSVLNLPSGKSFDRDDKGRGVTHLESCYSDGESFKTCSFRPELAVRQVV